MTAEEMTDALLKSGLTQQELGALLGIKQFDVSRIVHGKKVVSYELGKLIESTYRQRIKAAC